MHSLLLWSKQPYKCLCPLICHYFSLQFQNHIICKNAGLKSWNLNFVTYVQHVFFLRCRKNIDGLPLERNIHFRNSSVGYLIKRVLAQIANSFFHAELSLLKRDQNGTFKIFRNIIALMFWFAFHFSCSNLSWD